jgi:hypothetical protein
MIIDLTNRIAIIYNEDNSNLTKKLIRVGIWTLEYGHESTNYFLKDWTNSKY